MTEGDSTLGFKISLAAHVAVVVVGVFGGQLFQPDPEPPIEIVDAALISAEEFAALSEAPPPAPEEVEEQPRSEELAFAEPPPEEVEEPVEEPPALIEEAPSEEPPEEVVEEPVVEEPVVEEQEALPKAPYEEAPDAPSELAFDERALDDESPEDEIRKALPKPKTRTPEDLEKPSEEDQTPEVDLRQEPPPDPARPNIAEAPAQPEVKAADAGPKPDTPEEPVKEPPKEEPEKVEKTPPPAEVATAAPETAARPRGRPERPKKVAKEEPKKEPPKKQEPPKAQPEKKETDLAAILGKAVERGVQSPLVKATPRRAAPRTGPPLSGFEVDGLRVAIERCWRKPPQGVANLKDLVVTVFVRLDRGGYVMEEPTLSRPAQLTTQAQVNAYRSALAAIKDCQPYSTLPPGKYGQWREINITFDPVKNTASFN